MVGTYQFSAAPGSEGKEKEHIGLREAPIFANLFMQMPLSAR